MVIDELTDGTKIGQHLSSEIHGHERGTLGALTVIDADPDTEPSESGTFAFAVEVGGTEAERGTRLADVYLHPDRIRVEFLVIPDRAADAATNAGLRARPKAVDPPRTLVFVESGAEVKAALRVVERVAEQFLDDGG